MRINCKSCKVAETINPAYLVEMDNWGKKGMKVYRGKGCDQCSQTGFRGRVGIYELLVIGDEIRELILQKVSSQIIREKARAMGMTTLREDGWDKVAKGITTVEEILRVTINESNGVNENH